MKRNTSVLTIPSAIKFAISYLDKEIKRIRDQRMVIALDGHSSSGKSTIAREIASIIGYIHIDTGAMYRAVTHHLLENNIDIHNTELVLASIEDIVISFDRSDQGVRTILNDRDVEADIRTMHVSDHVSLVSTISGVRSFLVRQQRALVGTKGIVMDGRDIGTVVFPEADVKIFVTANLDVRSTRRYEELRQRGIDIDPTEVRRNLASRDQIDSTREDSPLQQAADAILLDTSLLQPNEQIIKALEIIIKAATPQL